MTKDNIQSIQNILGNLGLLIIQKTGEYDFSSSDQKLKFTLKLLIVGVTFNQF